MNTQENMWEKWNQIKLHTISPTDATPLLGDTNECRSSYTVPAIMQNLLIKIKIIQ